MAIFGCNTNPQTTPFVLEDFLFTLSTQDEEENMASMSADGNLLFLTRGQDWIDQFGHLYERDVSGQW